MYYRRNENYEYAYYLFPISVVLSACRQKMCVACWKESDDWLRPKVLKHKRSAQKCGSHEFRANILLAQFLTQAQ